MGIKAYLNLIREVRLRRVGDIGYRLWQVVEKRTGLLDRRFPPVTANFQDLVAQLAAPLTEADFMETFDRQSFYAGIDQKFGPADFDDLLAEAEDAVARKFAVIGGGSRHFPQEIDWFHSMNAEGTWSLTPWHSVAYRGSALGDIKACWEWNRHRHFPVLALATQVTTDEKFVLALDGQLQSWCKQNPPEMGIHYNSNLELGLRCISWIWAHFLARNEKGYSLQARRQFHLNLYYMARHIHGNLVYTEYTGRNNHLIGDASCLAVIALCCPHLSISRKWLDRALNCLWRALREQVPADGMHFELSFGYHVFVLEFVLQVVLLLRQRQISFPQFVLPTLEKMLDALLGFRLPDQTYPRLNDCDDGVVFPFHRDARTQLSTLFAIGAFLFNRCDFAYAFGGKPGIQARLLLGQEGLNTLARLAARAPDARVFSLEIAGLHSARSDWGREADLLIFDNHADPFPNSGHNHASSLQILLWLGGAPVLVDSGTYCYTVAQSMRNGLRGTAAHNTVVVDHRDQAIPHRDFGWISLLAPGKTTVSQSGEILIIQGDHQAYRSLKDPVDHHRAVIWFGQDRLWVVCDHFIARGNHHFNQHWHLSSSLKLEQENGENYRFGGDNQPEISIKLVDSQGEARLVPADGNPPPWLFESPSYGIARTKQVLERQWTKTGPHTVWTVFAAGNRPDPQIAASNTCMKIKLNSGTYQLLAGPPMTLSLC